jgi:CheY-like chemotaxis protein
MSYHILLIEDNADVAENISDILQLAHYQVSFAPDGKSGITLAQQAHPDLILCDIMMPGLDGYDVLQILNSDPETAHIPFIFLTAKAEKGDFRAGMNLGADDYITKPFEGAELLKVVAMRIKKNEQLRKSSELPSMENASAFFNKTKELREFQKLSENRPVRIFKKKDFLFMENQMPNELYYIESGKVKTFKVNYDGKELITGIHQSGSFLGYVPLLEEKWYNENAEVLEESKIRIIPKSDFLALIYSSKEVARKFIRLLSNNIEEMENRLLDIAYQSVRQRVASALLNIHDENPLNGNELIHMARKDLANIIGTATESLNRTLADFKDEGLIDLSSEGIRILKKPRLEQLVHR